MPQQDFTASLGQAIEELAKRTQTPKSPLPQSSSEAVAMTVGTPLMVLPPGLCEEAARIIFDYWERNAQTERGTPPIAWEALAHRYQVMWISITRLALEMAIMVVLSDQHRFLDDPANGDMGAAYARAAARYAEQILCFNLVPKK